MCIPETFIFPVGTECPDGTTGENAGDVEGEDELYKFIKLVMEGFWMMEELNSMDQFITQTEMKEHNKRVSN